MLIKEIRFVTLSTRKLYEKHEIVGLEELGDTIEFKLKDSFLKARTVRLEGPQECHRVAEEIRRWLDV
jgi:hypothetical protein